LPSGTLDLHVGAFNWTLRNLAGFDLKPKSSNLLQKVGIYSAVSPSGRLKIGYDQKGKISVYDLLAKKLTGTIKVISRNGVKPADAIIGLYFNLNETIAITSNVKKSILRRWDLKNHIELPSFRLRPAGASEISGTAGVPAPGAAEARILDIIQCTVQRQGPRCLQTANSSFPWARITS
jgi:hypothetical protein